MLSEKEISGSQHDLNRCRISAPLSHPLPYSLIATSPPTWLLCRLGDLNSHIHRENDMGDKGGKKDKAKGQKQKKQQDQNKSQKKQDKQKPKN